MGQTVAAKSQPVEEARETTASDTGLRVDGHTLPEAYLRRIELTPDRIFMRLKKEGVWQNLTWGQFHERVLGIYASYEKAGLKKGEKVAIFSQSRPEWTMADIANFCLGTVTVPIYYSNSVDDIAYILDHSEVKLILVEDEVSCKKLADAFQQMKRTLPVVVFFEKHVKFSAFPITYFEDFSATPASKSTVEASMRRTVHSHTPQDVASIVYTSGTTGRPKGAVLLHLNFASEIRNVSSELHFGPSDTTITFLPFAHIFGRVESLFPVFAGFQLNFAENINTVAKDIGEVGPTLLVSVPRIYEKIYAKIQSEIESQGDFKKKIFNWAVDVGKTVARLKADKASIPVLLAAKNAIADTLVFTKIRAKLGGHIRLTVSGGAPLNRDLCEFFHACGIMVLEGYGLTETTAAICANRPEDYCFGTVGRMFPGVEIRLAEDGEIQLRGPLVFKEYYKNKEATDEVFTKDGYFCTGDIGEINERGFLKITDRKKELIVTSGGKKIAPQKLENLLKASRFISNGMVYGDKEKFISALITLNEAAITKWAKDRALCFTSFKELSECADVVKVIEAEIAGINKVLANYESIKKFAILPADFTIETGELTPSLKVKRKICTQKYRAYIDQMYGS